MTEGTQRQLRVLHIASSGGIAAALQPSLFLPLLTKLPKQRVKVQVVSLARGCVPAAMLRQHGIPVHEAALSRSRFSVGALREIKQAAQKFRPDIIQAWGHTAQIVSIAVRRSCDWKPQVVWSVAETVPVAKKAGFIDRQKLKFAVKMSGQVDRLVYTSEAGAAHHRRAGYPDGGHECIAPGVDAARFKPDAAARTKVRERLQLPNDAFVVGMVAPFQPEYDHATFFKGIGELIKTNPHLYVLLAGHGVQRGNAPLMAMVGGGTLGTRTQLLGEWSDLSSLFNACDLVCSSALADSARMTLATAMLCGVPCVATGMGAQGELIGQHGIAVEPGSPVAFIRGIGKILEMTQERRIQLAQGARKYALQNFVYVRSLQKYLKLYCDLVGRDALAVETATVAVPAAAETLDVAIAAPAAAKQTKPKDHTVSIAEMADPDSLEAKVTPLAPETLPKWRIEQEQARAKQEQQLAASVSAAVTSAEGDVLQIFESEIAKPGIKVVSPMNERARGYVEEFEELLSPEALAAPTPGAKPVSDAVAEKQAEQAAGATPVSLAQEQTAVQAPPMPAVQSAPAAAHQTVVEIASGERTMTEQEKIEQRSATDAADLQTCATTDELPALVMTSSDAAGDTAPATDEPRQESLFDFDDVPRPPKQALSH